MDEGLMFKTWAASVVPRYLSDLLLLRFQLGPFVSHQVVGSELEF